MRIPLRQIAGVILAAVLAGCASQSRMSHHMAALKAAGLLVDRHDAQWVRYRRAPNLPEAVVTLVDAALAMPANQERHAA